MLQRVTGGELVGGCVADVCSGYGVAQTAIWCVQRHAEKNTASPTDSAGPAPKYTPQPPEVQRWIKTIGIWVS